VATKNGGKRPSRRAPPPPKQAEPPASAVPRARRSKPPPKATTTAQPLPSTTTAAPPRRRRAERAASAPTTSQADVGAQAAASDLATPALAGAKQPAEERPPAEEALPVSQADVGTPDLILDFGYEPDEDDTQPERPERGRGGRSNPLGTLIEHQFSAPGSPCRSYSDLERRSGISREALSRYVTSRRDRRRSPTIDTLVAIADAMHLSLLAVCRAAAASVRGVPLPPANVQRTREAVVSSLIDGLSDDQFSAVVELLRQMHPRGPGAS
jgi:transcriptional regulator with XRE-family HTH domain